ncbi:protein of unknown function [Burkholderia multivorans]
MRGPLDDSLGPDIGNCTQANVVTLKAGGQNRVLSYLNVGACEHSRSY